MAPQPTRPSPPNAPQRQLHRNPIPGVAILPPLHHPGPHQYVVGYELLPARANCACEGFSSTGVISIIVLILVFWPLFWLPLVMDDCFQQTQRPVYGDGPSDGPPVGFVNRTPPEYQGAPQYPPPPPQSGASGVQQYGQPYQAPPPPGVSGVEYGQPATGQPTHAAGSDPNFPDPVKPPKNV